MRLNVILDQPEIPGNTGSLIRLAAAVGFELHIAGPTLFEFTDTRLKRAGLDYHDLAVMTEHQSLDAAYAALRPRRVFAFTGEAAAHHTDIEYQDGDALLFGRESTGLDEHVKHDPRVTELVRIPMRPGIRSLNLANSASVVVYEAWRQHGFDGAV
ncbi:tRNA (cytidine(34)-2'-O)-methyltransferase [Nesterenkonia sp. NBAIMH1]|uniref:tRNA (cytidine(34)-2'-O)-methyltransferase n=1 Tax=Nesterenkonia sp. NBAIMH1 TaxID=2600320 RepID=UPI001FEDAC41|nr:tRNA (cytidine(34)-2'-O)-methyltransferase [Nesterenkonia sp. NBAIMH1]